MEEKTQLLHTLQAIDFTQLQCRLSVVKRRTKNGKASYKCLSTAISGLEDDFKSTIKDFFSGGGIHSPIQEISEYAALTPELDEDRALVHQINETDFIEIINEINFGADNQPVTEINQFHNSWALIVNFYNEDHSFFAFSKIKGGWNLKRSNTVGSWVFNEGQFEKVIQDKIFTFRNVFDFIAYGNDVFIRNKSNYELGLNIREGLEAKRDILIDKFSEHGIITSTDDLKIAIGTNKTLLRRLVSVEENRYFEDQEFIEDMKNIIGDHGWNMPEDDNGKFIIDENNVDLFLKLINDKRFISLIKKQMVDADSVELVSESQSSETN